MTPDITQISIYDNIEKIKKLLDELVLKPRLKALEWSKITDQTPSLKIGYPGQHLASLILGMKGTKTGARGHDIVDGSEVKSCNRVDASDKCNSCGSKVLRMQQQCPDCQSVDIYRDNTSKWLFTIRSEQDLKTLTEDVKRIVLILTDYPEFSKGNYDEIQFQAFEIWTNSSRCKIFKSLMTNYYLNIYLQHKKKSPAKTPAPKNFWPYSYQFYLCNPIKVFSCTIRNANTNPEIAIVSYITPDTDRATLNSELMPIEILKQEELQILIMEEHSELLSSKINGDYYNMFKDSVIKKNKAIIKELCPYIDEELRALMPLRDEVPFDIKTEYIRG